MPERFRLLSAPGAELAAVGETGNEGERNLMSVTTSEMVAIREGLRACGLDMWTTGGAQDCAYLVTVESTGQGNTVRLRAHFEDVPPVEFDTVADLLSQAAKYSARKPSLPARCGSSAF